MASVGGRNLRVSGAGGGILVYRWNHIVLCGHWQQWQQSPRDGGLQVDWNQGLGERYSGTCACQGGDQGRTVRAMLTWPHAVGQGIAGMITVPCHSEKRGGYWTS